MMAELIHRRQLKADTKQLLKNAQVSPKAMVMLYSGIVLILNMLTFVVEFNNIFSVFVSILTTLLTLALSSGFALYCMAIRRGERAEFLTLFDGFSFAGKIIALNIVMYFFICLWSMLFFFPGIIAAYRYRFALFNLYENPDIGVMEALSMSKRQTFGYKSQLFALDLSYIGWALLASIPASVESAFLAQEAVAFTASFVSGTMASPLFYSTMPAWVWALISGIWSLVVSLFYLANYQCVELGYFDIAKRTSGVGVSSAQDYSDESNHSNSF